MARFTVHHSDDACAIIIEGSRAKPEPTTAVIKFPGGHVEVTRCSDGTYWAHLAMTRPESVDDGGGTIIDSRLDYVHGAHVHYEGKRIPPLPAAEHIEHMAIRVARARGDERGR
jgi:hypothetical protein